MIADPQCERCGLRKVWIGIGPGAVPECPKGCDPVLPGSKCPHCRSLKIEPFEMGVAGWFGAFGNPDCWHCIDCGKVFSKKDAI